MFKHTSRVFPHLFAINRQESYGAADIDPKTGLPLDIGIHDLEGKGSANSSDGFFDKGIMQAFESDHAAAGTLKEVKVIGNGHCHSKPSSFVECEMS